MDVTTNEDNCQLWSGFCGICRMIYEAVVMRDDSIRMRGIRGGGRVSMNTE